MRNLALFAFGASVLITRTALAQPVTRDHRGTPPIVRPPVVRDHRTSDAPVVRDHRTTPPQPVVEPPPPPPPPPPAVEVKPAPKPVRYVHTRDHRLERFALERPVVSSYWPIKGTAGTVVRIRGRNFAPGTAVRWGGNAISGAHVEPEEIRFTVPRDAAEARIFIVTSDHDVAVGTFDIGAFDASGEWKKAERERRAKAESVALLDAISEHDLDATRDKRRAQEAGEIRTAFGDAFLESPDAQAELALHAQRIAELERMARLAGGDRRLAIRIEATRLREVDRHDRRMGALQEAFR